MYCGLYKSNKCSFYPQSFHLKYLNNYSLHSIRQANGVWRFLATQPCFWLHIFANTQGHSNVTVQFGLTTPNWRLRPCGGKEPDKHGLINISDRKRGRGMWKRVCEHAARTWNECSWSRAAESEKRGRAYQGLCDLTLAVVRTESLKNPAAHTHAV